MCPKKMPSVVHMIELGAAMFCSGQDLVMIVMCCPFIRSRSLLCWPGSRRDHHVLSFIRSRRGGDKQRQETDRT